MVCKMSCAAYTFPLYTVLKTRSYVLFVYPQNVNNSALDISTYFCLYIV